MIPSGAEVEKGRRTLSNLLDTRLMKRQWVTDELTEKPRRVSRWDPTVADPDAYAGLRKCELERNQDLRRVRVSRGERRMAR